MTEVVEVNIEEALALIDQGLGTVTDRELMSASEVADLLLDVRVLLASSSDVGEPDIADILPVS